MLDQEKKERVRELLQQRNLDAALLCNPFSVAWLCDYEMPIETGPSPFDGGPPLLLAEEGKMTLIVADNEEAAATELGIDIRAYPGYAVEEPMEPQRHLARVLGEVMQSKNRVGVEWNGLPAFLATVVKESVEPSTLASFDGLLEPLRAVKTSHEIERLRQSLALCDAAITVLRRIAREGATELELWNEMRSALEARAGGRLPLLADFVAGRRTADIGGPPGSGRVARGEWILADIVPRFHNYWGDICNVVPVGEISDSLRRQHSIVAQSLELAKSLIRPGASPAEIDATTRDFIRKNGFEPYPHHTGHGIGVSYHEAPRIVPCNHEPLAENMVIALEPGVYVPEVGGVRLEDVVRVTAHGCEVLTQHDKELA
jgi:Xaa-Pro aminopeptidase